MMAPSMAIVTGHYWRGSDGWWPLTSMMTCSYWWRSQDSRTTVSVRGVTHVQDAAWED
jgi:hypothetical protein